MDKVKVNDEESNHDANMDLTTEQILPEGGVQMATKEPKYCCMQMPCFIRIVHIMQFFWWAWYAIHANQMNDMLKLDSIPDSLNGVMASFGYRRNLYDLPSSSSGFSNRASSISNRASSQLSNFSNNSGRSASSAWNNANSAANNAISGYSGSSYSGLHRLDGPKEIAYIRMIECALVALGFVLICPYVCCGKTKCGRKLVLAVIIMNSVVLLTDIILSLATRACVFCTLANGQIDLGMIVLTTTVPCFFMLVFQAGSLPYLMKYVNHVPNNGNQGQGKSMQMTQQPQMMQQQPGQQMMQPGQPQMMQQQQMMQQPQMMQQQPMMQQQQMMQPQQQMGYPQPGQQMQ